MATLAAVPNRSDDADRFFLWSALAMALTIFAGFSLQLAAGRSSFSAPPLVHAHALIFMGWVVLYVAQNVFVARDTMTLHRRLGWIGAGWMVAMVIMGCAVTLAMVRRGQVPFFFQPLQFLVFDPLAVITFAGLTTAAIMLRRQTEWHRRLHFCGMALLLGPAFGRLLPMPLLAPWSYEADGGGDHDLPRDRRRARKGKNRRDSPGVEMGDRHHPRVEPVGGGDRLFPGRRGALPRSHRGHPGGRN